MVRSGGTCERAARGAARVAEGEECLRLDGKGKEEEDLFKLYKGEILGRVVLIII